MQVLAALPLVSAAVPTREFRFVNYGSSFRGVEPSIACDGKVAAEPGSGPTLQLTHWTDNETPDDLYADTSTECALRLHAARERGDYAVFDDAVVLNNHFDTDGVLAVWACLEPQEAARHARLLADGAAAGDFGEWPTDAGLKLDAAIETLGAQAGSDAAA